MKSITGGVTEVLADYEKVIVVEDDVLVSPGFLRFMNDALDVYSSDEQVMHVAAYCPFPPLRCTQSATTFFLNHTFCWGWGTWKRAWRHLSMDGRELRRRTRASGRRHYINLDGTHEFYGALAYLDAGRSQDWNCYWHVSVALRGGLCLLPTHSFVNNIGFDGSGTQCAADGATVHRDLADHLAVERIPLVEDAALRRVFTARPWREKFALAVRANLRPVYLPIKRAVWGFKALVAAGAHTSSGSLTRHG
jgi:hypothetical protein